MRLETPLTPLFSTKMTLLIDINSGAAISLGKAKIFDVNARKALLTAVLIALPAASVVAQHPRRSAPQGPPATKAPEAPTEPADTLPATSLEAIRANNVGVALMDLRRFPEAFAQFQSACILLPDSDTGCLNAGIALLNMNQFEQARKTLATAAARDPQNPRAWFTLGLLDLAQNQPDAALSDFRKAASLAPGDASTQCWIGQLDLDRGDVAGAFAAFNRALQIDPLSATAEKGIADVLASTPDTNRRKTHLDRYERLISLGLSQPLGSKYGEQGSLALAMEIPPPDVVPPASSVHFVDATSSGGLPTKSRMAKLPNRSGRHKASQPEPDAEPQVGTAADFLGSGACVFDYDGDGRPDIFLVDADGSGAAAIYRNLGHGRFVDATSAAKLDFRGPGMGCAVGDYDNDGHPDLAVSFSGGVLLFHNQGDGTFADVTADSGIRADGLCLGLTFIDYDHDGDLDLYISRSTDFPLANPTEPFSWPEGSNPPGNMLWRNKGDGTFANVTSDLGVTGDFVSVGAIASDFAGRGAPDLLLTGSRSTPQLLTNRRDGPFRAANPWGAETQGPTAGAVAFDFNKDGSMDVALTHWTPTTLGLWKNDGGNFKRVAIPDPGWMRAWGIATLDYDNDGWVDIVAVGETFSGEGRIVLLRNEGGRGFHDVTHDTGLDKIALHDPRSVIAFDAEGNGSSNLLITQNHRQPVLLRSVGGKNNWIQVALHGDGQNAMGLGIPVEILSGASRQRWEVPAASGYLSQGPAAITIGLGQQGLDAVRAFWKPPLPQVELGPFAGSDIVVTEGADQREDHGGKN